jgi:hypothetical protein
VKLIFQPNLDPVSVPKNVLEEDLSVWLVNVGILASDSDVAHDPALDANMTLGGGDPLSCPVR